MLNILKKYRAVLVAVLSLLVVGLMALWFVSRDDSDGRRLMEELATTALPEGTYNIVVASPDDTPWMTAIAGMSNVTTEALEPLTEDSLWIAYANAPTLSTDNNLGMHYEIVTIGFESSEKAKAVFDEVLLGNDVPEVATRFIWRHHGSTLQGLVSPPHDYIGQFPTDAPVIDMEFKGAAYRLNATGWADVLIQLASDDDKEHVEAIVTSLGISLDPESPSVVVGVSNRDGVIEAETTGWQKGNLEAIPYHITAGRTETCDDETGEQCSVTSSRLESIFYESAIARVVGDELSNVTSLERRDAINPDWMEHGNIVGYFNPEAVASAIASGGVAQYTTDFRWFNFAVTKEGKVLIEPFIEPRPQREPVPAAPSDS